MTDPTGGTGSIWAEPLVWILGAVTTMATTLAGRVVYQADKKEDKIVAELEELKAEIKENAKDFVDYRESVPLRHPSNEQMHAAIANGIAPIKTSLELIYEFQKKELSDINGKLDAIVSRELQRRRGDPS